MTNATAVHCVAIVGFGKPIIMTNISMEMAHTRALHIMMGLRPNFSMVYGRGYVPIANPVFMTAAKSCER
jgi:hypothetical protein